METVEIVIKLPKGVLDCVKDIYADGDMPDESSAMETVLYAVANGTVLPKGHGRLVDADKISRVNYAEEDNLTGYGMTYDEMGAYNDGINDMYRLVKNAPTVIEADREVENG